MKAQVLSEARKLLSTRTTYLFLAGAVGMSILAVTSVSGQPASEMAKPFEEQQFYFLYTFVKILIIVLGIRVVTDEFRYGTVMPTFTFSPRRLTVVGAKALVAAAAGTAIAIASLAVLVGSAAAVFSMNGATLAFGEGAARALGGAVLAGGLWAVIGVGIGAAVRNQVIAIVGALVWLMALEEMLRSRLGDFGGYLPGQNGIVLSLGFTLRATVVSAVVMVAYAVAGLIVGGFVARRIDIA